MPEESGCVRMDCFGGFVFTPRKDDPTKCDMMCVMGADLKGNIPQWVTL